MRLINVLTLQLHSFEANQIPPYAILSHTWTEEEVVFEEFDQESSKHKSGYQKIKSACTLTSQHGYMYLWVDTCCIDKRSSAELSEAINSMCLWYQKAMICFAYLADVDFSDSKDHFFRSRWWKRGWTLQELIAPKHVLFLARNWSVIGAKDELSRTISRSTGIHGQALISLDAARTASLAERMSWAADRATTRIEDRAYSLLGLFDVSMPLLYGEGSKAFVRLQEEIIRTSADQSIFAWGFSPHRTSLRHLPRSIPSNDQLALPKGYTTSSPLASSPESFRDSRGIVPRTMDRELHAFSITNLGLQIRLPVTSMFEAKSKKGAVQYSVGILACTHSDRKGQFLCILLRCEKDTQRYARLCWNSGITSTIHIELGLVLDAVTTKIVLTTVFGENYRSDLPAQLNANKFAGFGSKVAIRLDRALELGGWCVSEIAINSMELAHGHQYQTEPSPQCTVLDLDDWREHNTCAFKIGSRLAAGGYALKIEFYQTRPIESACIVSPLTSEAHHPDMDTLGPHATRVSVGQVKSFSLGASKESGKDSISGSIDIEMRSNVILEQRVFVLSIRLGKA